MSKIKLNINREYFRERSDEINLFNADEKKEAEKIIEKLREYLRNHPGLVALSAPQIGYRYRIFCMKFQGNDIRTFINPLVIARKEIFFNEEIQIGFDDLNKETYFVPRYREITAGYQTPTGKVESNVFKDMSSAVFEQMVHLLDGVFISDFGLIKLDGFDTLTEEDKKMIFDIYMQNTLNNKESIEKIISENVDDEQIDKMTKYYTDALTGKIEILTMTEEEKKQYLENKSKEESKK